MLAALERPFYTAGSGVSQSKEPHTVDIGIEEYIILIGGELCTRSQFSSRSCTPRVDVANTSHIPKVILDKLPDVLASHSAEAKHSY